MSADPTCKLCSGSGLATVARGIKASCGCTFRKASAPGERLRAAVEAWRAVPEASLDRLLSQLRAAAAEWGDPRDAAAVALLEAALEDPLRAEAEISMDPARVELDELHAYLSNGDVPRKDLDGKTLSLLDRVKLLEMM